MELDADKLIKMFYEEVVKDYPDLSIEQISEICKSPFRHIAQQIANDNLPKIIIKYFGTFDVYPGKIKNLMGTNEAMFKLGKIKEETYLKRRKGYEDLLSEVEAKLIQEEDDTEVRIID